MIDEACNNTMIDRKELKGVPLSVLCDKGERQNKKGRVFLLN